VPAFAFLAVSLFWCLAPHTHNTRRTRNSCTRAQGLHTRPKQAVAQRVSLLHMERWQPGEPSPQQACQNGNGLIRKIGRYWTFSTFSIS
jgi:hypothetical protein